jgi:hypothetical protein
MSIELEKALSQLKSSLGSLRCTLWEKTQEIESLQSQDTALSERIFICNQLLEKEKTPNPVDGK